MPLSKVVLSRLKELGTLPAQWTEPREVGGHPLPEPLRQLANVTFPEGRTFRTSEQDTPWVWGLELGDVSEVDAKELGLEWDGRPLGCIGLADGGNFLILIRLDDKKPSDPLVYTVDHDEPGQTLSDGVRLSKLLTALKIDAEAPKRTAKGSGLALSKPFRLGLSTVLEKTASLTKETLARVRSLALSGANDLSDLQYFPALENLQLHQCVLDDLGALSQTPKLVRLFATASAIGDWSAVRSLPSLRELHVPLCGLQSLSFFPDGLTSATITANPLGPANSADLARLPRATLSLPHPGPQELELNEALRSKGLVASCMVMQLQNYVVRPVPHSRTHLWHAIDAAELRQAIATEKDLGGWIDARPQTRALNWQVQWRQHMKPALHP